MSRRAVQAMEKLGTIGFPMPPQDLSIDMKKLLTVMEAMAEGLAPKPPPPINIVSEPSNAKKTKA